MHIEYRVTIDDTLTFTAYHFDHSPALRRVTQLWGYGVAAAFVAGFGIAARTPASRSSVGLRSKGGVDSRSHVLLYGRNAGIRAAACRGDRGRLRGVRRCHRGASSGLGMISQRSSMRL